ncbi:hypothetical protein D3C71_1120840 [compost metagenome]
MRIEIIRAPCGKRHLVFAAAHLGQNLTVLGRLQTHLDADIGKICLDGLRQIRVRLGGIVIHGDFETVGKTGFRHQRLGLFDIALVRRVVNGAGETFRLEALVNLVRQRHNVFLHALVVQRPFDGLPDLWLGKVLIALIERDQHQRGDALALQLDVGVVLDGTQLFRGQVAGNVDIALLQHQKLGRRIGDMAQDDALDVTLVGAIRVDGERYALARLPGLQHEIAGTGAVFLQPAIAEVFARGICQHGLLFNDRADIGGEAIEQERDCGRLCRRQLHRLFVGGNDGSFGIVRREAELADDEGRALVHLDGALQRKGHVFRGHFRTAREGRIVTNHKGENLAFRIGFPGLRDDRIDLGGIFTVRPHQLLVHVGDDFTADGFETLMRIKARHVVQLLRDHQNILGCRSKCRNVRIGQERYGSAGNQQVAS